MAWFRAWRHCTESGVTRGARERSSALSLTSHSVPPDTISAIVEGGCRTGCLTPSGVHLEAAPDWRTGIGLNRPRCRDLSSVASGEIVTALWMGSSLSSLRHNIGDRYLRILMVP